jgi:hypothetical protein
MYKNQALIFVMTVCNFFLKNFIDKSLGRVYIPAALFYAISFKAGSVSSQAFFKMVSKYRKGGDSNGLFNG